MLGAILPDIAWMIRGYSC